MRGRHWIGDCIGSIRTSDTVALASGCPGFVCCILRFAHGRTSNCGAPQHLVRPFVVFLLIVMLLYTWFKPDFGNQDAHVPISRNDLIRGLLIGTAIGFYEGFFGPGAGSFLIFLFVRVFHFDFMRATACAKVVNMSTNLGALAYFIPAGLVIYPLAIPMVFAMIGGSFAGSHLAMKGGNRWLRRLFLVLVLGLLSKLVVDLIRG